MSNEIRLVPSWYGKIPLEKGCYKQETDTVTMCCGGNENDKYISPIYNESQKSIESIKPFSKLPTLTEQFELDDLIRPLYKNLLNGMEFYKFYLNKVKNNMLDRNTNDLLQQPINISTSQHVEISNIINNKQIIKCGEDIIYGNEPIEDIEKYKTKVKKGFNNYENDIDDMNYNYSDDDYNIYSDFETK
jgi:hypothetical protein